MRGRYEANHVMPIAILYQVQIKEELAGYWLAPRGMSGNERIRTIG